MLEENGKTHQQEGPFNGALPGLAHDKQRQSMAAQRSGERQPDREQQAEQEGADGGLLEGAGQHLPIEALAQGAGGIGEGLDGGQEDPGPDTCGLGQQEGDGGQQRPQQPQ